MGSDGLNSEPTDVPIMSLHNKLPRHATPRRGYNRQALRSAATSPSRGTEGGLNVFEQRGGAMEVQVETAHFERLKKKLKEQKRKENAKELSGFLLLLVVQIGRSHSAASAGEFAVPTGLIHLHETLLPSQSSLW